MFVARLSALSLVTVSLGCATTAATAPSPAVVPNAADVAPPASTTAPAASTTTSTTLSEAPPAAPPLPEPESVRAADSLPEGFAPLTNDETNELSTTCKPFVEAVAAAASKLRGKGTAELVREVLASPPRAPGVDVPRCSALMLRDLEVYQARAIETEATSNLKRISFAMSSAMLEANALCPPAPATPASLGDFVDGRYASKLDDWKTAGWSCLRFDQVTPQRFQYEVRVDAKAGTYEAIARRPALAGRPSYELFVRGRVENGDLPPSSDVMRRRAR